MQAFDPKSVVDDRPSDGVFRVHKDAFRSQEIYDLEIARIFEGTWVFVGLESDVRNPNDFFTNTIGRHPVLVMRSAEGELGAFVNSCRHRGARICQISKGNKRRHTCPYHGWTYASSGKLWNLKDKDTGAYTPAFDLEDHDLARVPRFDSYRGFLFVSFNPDVPSLSDHLGDGKVLIDLLCDQSPVGEVEFVAGRSIYTYKGNWKLQLENCTDGYHFTSTHTSFLRILAHRKEVEDHKVSKTIFGDDTPIWASEEKVGTVRLPNGIVFSWTPNTPHPSLPIYAAAKEIEARVGANRLKWMCAARNVTFFPNMQIASNFSSQIRVMRPLGPGKTEMVTYCVAPVGESAESRTLRLRQYEDFFNPTGVATPDDSTVYEDCQAGNYSDVENWHQGYMRGVAVDSQGEGIITRELGIVPEGYTESTFALQDETVFHGLYREWARLMGQGAKAAHPERAEVAA